jgi:hypothetical protein
MYVKLFTTILTSSVWATDPATRLVWITLLAMADKDGDVRGSVTGIARMANVPVEDTRRALELLAAPDPESQTPDEEGRRIIVQQGGWHIVNYAKYRAIQDHETRKATWRESAKKYRAKRQQTSTNVQDTMLTRKTNPVSSTEAEAEAEAETEAEASGNTHAALSFADPSHQSAYESTRRAARDPIALDATLVALRDGMHGTAYPLGTIGQALLEMRAAGTAYTPNAVRAFCKRLTAPDPAPTRRTAPTDRITAGRDALKAALEQRRRDGTAILTPDPVDSHGF